MNNIFFSFMVYISLFCLNGKNSVFDYTLSHVVKTFVFLLLPLLLLCIFRHFKTDAPILVWKGDEVVM